MTRSGNIKPGWKSVIQIYPSENWIALLAPAVLSILGLILVGYSSKDIIESIDYICKLIIAIIPGILGFTLTGYALLIGFSNSELIKPLTVILKNETVSFFQRLNSTFAYVLGALSITLVIGGFVGFIVNLNLTAPECISWIMDPWNYIALFFVFYCCFYSLITVKDIVINIFNFGQYAQRKFEIDREREDLKKTTN